MLSREWRCSWSSADRRCSNYIWVIDSFIAYYGASYIRDFTVVWAYKKSNDISLWLDVNNDFFHHSWKVICWWLMNHPTRDQKIVTLYIDGLVQERCVNNGVTSFLYWPIDIHSLINFIDIWYWLYNWLIAFPFNKNYVYLIKVSFIWDIQKWT